MLASGINRRAHLLAILLAATGWACAAVRIALTPPADTKSGKKGWRLHYEVSGARRGRGGRLLIYLPRETRCLKIERESIESPDYILSHGAARRRSRTVTAIPVTDAADASFTADFDIFPRGREHGGIAALLDTTDRALYLRQEPGIPAGGDISKQVLASFPAGKNGPRETADRAFGYCSDMIVNAGPAVNPDGAAALKELCAGAAGQSRAMAALCRTAKIPARLVTGFILRAEKNAVPHHWVEAYVDGRWHPFDPAYRYAWRLPAVSLPVSRGTDAVVVPRGEITAGSRFSIRRIARAAAPLTLASEQWWAVLDLTRLPIGTRRTLGLILLLPLGALITAVFRNIAGLRTFGTFTPALLALSIILSDWRIGIAVFAVVIVFAVANRFVIETLKLLMVPRLGVVLTGVVACMALTVSVLHYLDLSVAASHVLLPVVIVVMIAERFYVTETEDGLKNALTLGLGTLIVAAVCYGALRSSLLRETMVLFPEGLFFIIALLVVIGRYAGYRVTELFRFRDAVEGMPGQ